MMTMSIYPMNDDAFKLYGCMGNANEVMYSVCKLTRLGMIVRLFHIKCLNKVIDIGFDMLLDLL